MGVRALKREVLIQQSLGFQWEGQEGRGVVAAEAEGCVSRLRIEGHRADCRKEQSQHPGPGLPKGLH